MKCEDCPDHKIEKVGTTEYDFCYAVVPRGMLIDKDLKRERRTCEWLGKHVP